MALAGKPIADPGKGSDIVAEFRTLPGYHHPAAWRPMGKAFLKAGGQTKKRSSGSAGARPLEACGSCGWVDPELAQP